MVMQCSSEYLEAGVLGIGSGGSIGGIDLDLEGVDVGLQAGLPCLQGCHRRQDLLQGLFLLGGRGRGWGGCWSLQQGAAPA